VSVTVTHLVSLNEHTSHTSHYLQLTNKPTADVTRW